MCERGLFYLYCYVCECKREGGLLCEWELNSQTKWQHIPPMIVELILYDMYKRTYVILLTLSDTGEKNGYLG